MKSKQIQFRLEEQTHDVARSRQSKGQGVPSPLSPGLRSWIKNCLVPILVDKYLAERRIKMEVALGQESVRDSTQATRKSLGCNIQ